MRQSNAHVLLLIPARTLFSKGRGKGTVMANSEVQPRSSMYQVQPYFKIKKIQLPDCMYLLHPIHSPAYWKALVRSRQCTKILEYKQILHLVYIVQEDGGEISLDNMEKRQDDLIAELQKLNDKVTQLSEKLGVDPTTILQQVIKNCYTLKVHLLLYTIATLGS